MEEEAVELLIDERTNVSSGGRGAGDCKRWRKRPARVRCAWASWVSQCVNGTLMSQHVRRG
eukprot:115291-Chlamydomonas_euryale.AAC.3